MTRKPMAAANSRSPIHDLREKGVDSSALSARLVNSSKCCGSTASSNRRGVPPQRKADTMTFVSMTMRTGGLLADARAKGFFLTVTQTRKFCVIRV